MYEITLAESYFPAQHDDLVLDTTIGGVLRAAASAHGDAEYLVEARADGGIGRRWTCRALLDDAERLARALATRFAPGERVAVWAPNAPEWVLLEFAAALAGLTLVTVNPAYQAKELATPARWFVLDAFPLTRARCRSSSCASGCSRAPTPSANCRP